MHFVASITGCSDGGSDMLAAIGAANIDELFADAARGLLSVIVVNPETGARHWAFRSVTPEQRETQGEFLRRGEAGVPRMELFTPELWAPLPGLLTGLIVGGENDPVYLTGIGDAIVRLDR